MPELIKEQVSLDNYPTKIARPKPGAKIAFGDLDGNAIKFLYFLIREGILEISPDEYKKLTQIYNMPPETITKQVLADFNNIIQKAKVAIPAPEITFIGDTVCDRGMNDYYTLKLFEKLSVENVKFKILASNHDAQFLKQYAYGLDSKNETFYSGEQSSFGRSLINLQTLLKNKAVTGVTTDELNLIMMKHYLPNLILFTCEQTAADQLNVFSHTPTDPLHIEAVTSDLIVKFKDDTQPALMLTIDQLNENFRKILFHSDKDTLLNLLESSSIDNLLHDRYEDLATQLKSKPGLNYKRNYSVMNIHGHVSNEEPDKNTTYMWKFTNLDAPVGKIPGSVDWYRVYTNNTDYRELTPAPNITAGVKDEAPKVSTQNIFTTAPKPTENSPSKKPEKDKLPERKSP